MTSCVAPAKRRRRLVLLITVAFHLLTVALGGGVFVPSALERAQFYSGTCASADRPCAAGKRVGLPRGGSSGHLVSSLNLFLHLSGVLQGSPLVEVAWDDAADLLVPVVPTLSMLVFSTSIFHPPKV